MADQEKKESDAGPGTPRWTHRMDQIQAGGKDMGRIYAGYHAGMVDGGMSRHEASQALSTHIMATHISQALRDIAKELGSGGFPGGFMKGG